MAVLEGNNLSRNPTAKNNITDWIGNSGDSSKWVRQVLTGSDTVGDTDRKTFGRRSVSANTQWPDLGDSGTIAASPAASGGKTYSYVAWVRSSHARQYRHMLGRRNGTGYQSGDINPTTITSFPANEWVKVRGTGTIPTGGTYNAIGMHHDFPNSVSAASTLDVGAVRIVEGNVPDLDFADGDSDGWQWDGTSGNSASRKTPFQVIQGSADLDGAGSVSTSATPVRPASTILGGAGSLVSDPRVVQPAAADLNGAGSLTSAAVPIAQAGTTLNGAGSILPDVTREQFVSAPVKTAGSVSTSIRQTGRAIGSLSGAGRVTASAQATFQVAASLQGAGSIAAGGVRQVEGGTQIRGAGSVLGDAVRAAEVSATLAGGVSVFADLRKTATAFFVSRGSARGNLVRVYDLDAPPAAEVDASASGSLTRARQGLAATAQAYADVQDASLVALRVIRDERLEVTPLILGTLQVTYFLTENYVAVKTEMQSESLELVRLTGGLLQARGHAYGTQSAVYVAQGHAQTDALTSRILSRVTRPGNAGLASVRASVVKHVLGRLRPMYTGRHLIDVKLRGRVCKAVIFGRTATVDASIRPPMLHGTFRFFRVLARARAYVKERAERFVETTAYALGGTRVVHDRSIRSLRGYVTAVASMDAELHDAAPQHSARADALMSGSLLPVRHLDQFITIHARVLSADGKSVGMMSSVVRVIPFDDVDSFHEEMPPFGDHTHGDDGRIVVNRTFMGMR